MRALDIFAVVSGIAVSVAIIYSENLTQSAISDRETRTNYTQMALGILAQQRKIGTGGSTTDFTEDQIQLRRWAVGVLNHYNESLPIPEELQESIITGRATIQNDYNSPANYDFGDFDWMNNMQVKPDAN